ncbi:MAG: C25 family cysteine peptidase [Planctomycetota bacterium]
MISTLFLCLMLSDVDALRLSSLDGPEGGTEYLIVCPDELGPAAAALAAHRERHGLRASWVSLSQIETVYGTGPEAILGFLRRAVTEWDGEELRYLLLMGDTPSSGYAGVPTFRVPGTRKWKGPIASDHPYACPLGGSWPMLAVGRLPVSDLAEARGLVRRIRERDDDRSPGAWRHRIALFGERGGFGARADAIIENGVRVALDLLVPQTLQIEATVELPGSPFFPDPADFHDALIESIHRGNVATIYAGHGNERGLGRVWTGRRSRPIFDGGQVGNLKIEEGGSVFFLFACSTTAFDEPEASFAERLVLHETGPVAVIGASHLSHPFADIQLGRCMCRVLGESGERRLGDLFLAGKRALASPDWFAGLVEVLARASGEVSEQEMRELPGYELAIYTLLGDPGMTFGLPRGRVSMITEVNGRTVHVRGEVPGIEGGSVKLALHRRRGRPSDQGAGPGPRSDDDEVASRERRLETWRRVNDTEVFSLEVEITGGRFEAELVVPGGVRSGLYVLHAYAHGAEHDATGAADCWLR